ncbi:MAG: hypothetical protein RLZZ519_1501, partial [Bacteroidota bacterium]
GKITLFWGGEQHTYEIIQTNTYPGWTVLDVNPDEMFLISSDEPFDVLYTEKKRLIFFVNQKPTDLAILSERMQIFKTTFESGKLPYR